MSEGGLEERDVRPKQRRIVGDPRDRGPDPLPPRPAPQELVAVRAAEFREQARIAWRERGLEELREVAVEALTLRLCERSPAQPGETLIEVRTIHALEEELDKALGLRPQA